MMKWVGLVALLLAAVALSACGELGTPTVKSAKLAKSFVDGKAVDETKNYSPGNHTFNLIVEVGSAPVGTTVGATWYQVNAGDIKNQKLQGNEISLKGNESLAHFTLTNQSDWTPGKYKVDITLNGKAERTLDFQVQ